MPEPVKRSRELRIIPEWPAVLLSHQLEASSSQRLMFLLAYDVSVRLGLQEHLMKRPLSLGRMLYVDRIAFDRAQIGIARNEYVHEYERCYIYECLSCCVGAALTWNGVGDPYGWVRCTEGSQLPRRRPGGDGRREFVAP